ncbi:MAG: HAD hydrolase-like protein [Ruminococcus sp.]|jgi:phosphoglycolate phosphatase|nr:HAD hydrolase-like protein [Ruminococcus sp.]
MKSSVKYKYILFDLDGTLSASASGIRYSLEKTCEELNVTGVDFSDYTKYIGPPLVSTFKNICKFPDELYDKAYDIYMRHYAEKGILMNKAYDGIEDVLINLRAEGYKLAVCSSKLEENSEKVVDIIGLTKYFDAICGSNRDSTRKDKKDLIPYAVERLGGNTAEAVMIGDTYFDALGAELCEVDFIACAFGYGKVEDMLKHPYIAVAEKPSDIFDIITKS